jgi:two-component system CheB/CheR fusion protein
MLSTIYSIFRKKFAESENTDVELILKVPDETVLLNTDESRLIQIFSNLLDNALRFTSKGNVTFGISDIAADKATFFVTDTGIGISKENHARIFDRFSQANGSTRSYGGTGLGLTIVKKLLEMMGSEIILESEPGKGATFRFQLDSSSAPRLEEKADVNMEYGSKKLKQKRILVVEDDPVSRMYFKQLLAETEAGVIFAENGEEALRLYKSHSPDVILLDIGLPDISGLEVVRRIRETDEKVIVVAQTAFAMYDDKQSAMEAGCNDYITKPIHSALLLQKLEQLCS